MNRNDDFNMDLFGDFKPPHMDSSYKLPLCLVLDKSGSMMERAKTTSGSIVKIDELNSNVKEFINYIKNDPKASKICDLCIIAFGGSVDLISDYSKIEDIPPFRLIASGRTPLGEAVKLSIELLEKRRQYYRDNGIEHYKPIMLLMSDGAPTDKYESIAKECTKKVNNKDLKIFPVGIGHNFRDEILSEFSPLLHPKRITDMDQFTKLFYLLSKSTSDPTDDSIVRWFNDEI